MASKGRFESLTEEVICPICLDFFTDPVSLECGHNFCRSCITQSWDREGRNSCPECREKFTDRSLRVSWALARLSEKARTLSLNRTEKESKLQCEEHEEELKLFCETDKKLICVICAAGREHESHCVMLVKEAVETYKDQVKSSIQSLTKNKLEIQQMEQQQIQKISAVLEQSHNLQSKITYQFAELHQILIKKEQYVLADIREEEKNILNTMEKNLGKIETKKKSIEVDILKLQQQIDQKDSVIFLKEEADRKRRVRDETKPLSVVDEALPIEKFICPALFKTVFSETSDDFKQVSVILDAETAHPELEVSENRKMVRQNGNWIHLREDNGKRFMSSPCILGSEGFTSGRHYWEAEMRGFYGWTIGVAAESVERKGWVKRSPKAGVWSIRRSGELFEAFTCPATSLPVRSIPFRVGVCLSYESGTVSFYDADTKSHLYTFNGCEFTEKLYPFFWVRGGNWLRIGFKTC